MSSGCSASASGHNTHAVCVWEYETSHGSWLPYSPAISQHLERAYAKKLTRVLLSDADPTLDKCYVNVRTMMTQESEDAMNVASTSAVRRMFYTPSSPAGKGTKWEWSSIESGGQQQLQLQLQLQHQHPQQQQQQPDYWQPYNMHVQCIIEEAWAKGEQTFDLHYANMPYTINFCNLTQTQPQSGVLRSIRRTQQAPYPLVKLTPQQALQLNASNNNYADYIQQKRNNTLPKTQGVNGHEATMKMQRFALALPQMHTTNGNRTQQQLQQQQQTHHQQQQLQQQPPAHHHQQQQQQQQQPHHQSHREQARKHHKKSNEISTTNLRQILHNWNIFGHSTKHHAAATTTQSTQANLCAANHLQPFKHTTTSTATTAPVNKAGGSSMHSRCSDGSLQSSQRSSRMGSHRSRSRTRASDTDTNSMKSNRRPSVDTVSTYLSHESKESLRSRNFAISVNDLLDCSLGSDDVFTERAPAPPPLPLASAQHQQHQQQLQLQQHHQHHQQPLPQPSASSLSSLSSSLSRSSSVPAITGSIVGIDPASDMISRFVKVVEPPTWPNAQPCPVCLQELVHSVQNPSIALSRCQHLMHLQCLNGMIIAQQQEQQQQQHHHDQCNDNNNMAINKGGSLFIECPVCGIVYGEKVGNQPVGTMSWTIISKSLPGHERQNTIQIVYDIASGIQTVEHPHPGRAFFAVGFPRVCYLPDCPLGRKVLRFLKIAFDRRLLFSIGRSVTTGREDVVIWNSVDHKTQFNMFPDPTYLQRCMQQLVHLGVTD